jgi:DNA-binding transcriptional regulator GbsR (MarR family)
MPALHHVPKQFILHWGEMGTRWGVNRTVAQIHALLFISPDPLSAEEIASTLAVARSNVSTSLRELQSWGLIRPVHVLGDRRTHYESMKDVWEMFRVIIDQRKRREMDPTLESLRRWVAELERGNPADRHTRERLLEMLEFFETLAALYAEARELPSGTLRGFVKMRGRLRKLVGFKPAG